VCDPDPDDPLPLMTELLDDEDDATTSGVTYVLYERADKCERSVPENAVVARLITPLSVAPTVSCALPAPSGGVPGPVTIDPFVRAPDATKLHVSMFAGVTTIVRAVTLGAVLEDDDPVPDDPLPLCTDEPVPVVDPLPLPTEDPVPVVDPLPLEADEPLPDDTDPVPVTRMVAAESFQNSNVVQL
jgi:hypothetical protein